MSITAAELEVAINSDGNLLNGEPLGSYNRNMAEIWWEASEGDEIDVLGIGKVEIVESAVGKTGDVTFEDGVTIWTNHLLLKFGDQYFRQLGTYNSWDGQGPEGHLEEVKKVEKTIEVWEEV